MCYYQEVLEQKWVIWERGLNLRKKEFLWTNVNILKLEPLDQNLELYSKEIYRAYKLQDCI